MAIYANCSVTHCYSYSNLPKTEFVGVPADRRPPIVLIEPGVIVNVSYYREYILEAYTLFVRRPWTFQQDWSLSHNNG